MNDEQAMELALAQARLAALAGEVPVGAVVLRQGKVIAAAHNAPISQNNPTAHAEVIALCQAASMLGNYRLDDCELFVTLEPCVMCVGTILQTRLKRVVFAAAEPKTGAAGSVVNLFEDTFLNHQTSVKSGVLAESSAQLLRDFFRQKRIQQIATWPLRDDALRTPEACFVALRVLTAPLASAYMNHLSSLQGLRLHYLESQADQNSDRPVTVFLHAPLTWSHVWLDEMQMQHTQGQRVLAPDMIGFGKSDKPKKQGLHTLDWHVQVLHEWLCELGLSKITLRVESANLVVARTWAQIHPLQISQIIEQSPAAMTRAECAAPYPDAGHLAALRALTKPSWQAQSGCATMGDS
jgi:tRNA(adenine34) deaminase